MELKSWKVFGNLLPTFASNVRLAMVAGRKEQVGLVVTRDDDVYSIGSSCKGLLGVPGITSSPVPVRMEELCGKGVVDIRCGDDFFAVVAKDGAVYTWGCNEQGQLGIGIIGGIKDVAQKVDLMSCRICQISCGSSHTLALTSDRVVYAWGGNNCGQVGDYRRCKDPVISTPTGLRLKCLSVVCSALGSFALYKDGWISAWGKPEVCNPSKERRPIHKDRIPMLIYFPEDFCRGEVKQLVAGENSVMALCFDGKLKYWGSNQRPPSQIAGHLGPVVEIAGIWFSDTFAFRTASDFYVYESLPGEKCLTEPKIIYGCTSFDHLFLAYTGAMWRPLVLEQVSTGLVDLLVPSFDDSDTGDVRFDVEGKIIWAHKTFLKIRSEYFRKMFGGNWKENSEEEIKIQDATYSGFRSFLQYFYTDAISPKSSEEACELLKLADRYGELDIIDQFGKFLKPLLSKENACELYELAVMFHAKEVEKRILEFMALNFTAVVTTQDFRLLSGELIRRLIRKLVAQRVMRCVPFVWDDSRDDKKSDVDTDDTNSTPFPS